MNRVPRPAVMNPAPGAACRFCQPGSGSTVARMTADCPLYHGPTVVAAAAPVCHCQIRSSPRLAPTAPLAMAHQKNCRIARSAFVPDAV